MSDDPVFQLAAWEWGLALFGALTVSFSKCGIPGVGILAIPLFAVAFRHHVGQSVGILLPLLIFGDVLAIAWYRQHAVWRHVLRVLPWAVAGIVAGFLLLRTLMAHMPPPVVNACLQLFIGAIVLAVLALGHWVQRRADAVQIPHRWWFAAVIGLLAGVCTMVANAAGPIWVVYLLALRLPKEAFLGTGAWAFLLLNSFKVPFQCQLGNIWMDSLVFGLKLTPALLVGAVLGVYAARRIRPDTFRVLVLVLAVASSVKLVADGILFFAR